MIAFASYSFNKSHASAYSILAEIGSLKQYSAKELSAISGLAPRIKQSGSSVDYSFMSRRSSGRLRQILYLDSVPGLPKIPFLQDFYQRLHVNHRPGTMPEICPGRL